MRQTIPGTKQIKQARQHTPAHHEKTRTIIILIVMMIIIIIIIIIIYQGYHKYNY